MNKPERTREEVIERIKEHQEMKAGAIEQGKMSLAKTCQTVITEMMWVLEVDFLDELEEFEDPLEDDENIEDSV